MDKKISFIGCGNMAKAIIQGLIASGTVDRGNIAVSDVNAAGAKEFAEKTEISFAEINIEAVERAEVVFLCVKPQCLQAVCRQISEAAGGKLIVSIAAGVSCEKLALWLGKDKRIVRTMPNVAITVGSAMTAVCFSEYAESEDIALVKRLFSALGKAILIDEEHIDAFISIASSSPAMMFMIIEAMADGGVMLGLPRSDAYLMASQAMLGSAQMMLSTGKHPGELKDMVCSPAGTTIEMVASLELDGLRSAVIESMIACADKCKNIKS